MNKAKEIPASETLHDLVGRNIMHRFIEENGQYIWYNGTVISQVPGFPEWFNLKYEDDDDIYTARLEEEFQDGDVLIRV
ncbi:hypothetical protein DPMN_011914 [Dreissena polymorpha]|uniref:Uncharacterized protein n=1 Tax=Dreissena polymorpha TaxID=45954 RepID=A0A9D4N713_DREPO|nr:hypothetical protein DPMN_011914 [Dreissena polymorpha]